MALGSFWVWGSPLWHSMIKNWEMLKGKRAEWINERSKYLIRYLVFPDQLSSVTSGCIGKEQWVRFFKTLLFFPTLNLYMSTTMLPVAGMWRRTFFPFFSPPGSSWSGNILVLFPGLGSSHASWNCPTEFCPSNFELWYPIGNLMVSLAHDSVCSWELSEATLPDLLQVWDAF